MRTDADTLGKRTSCNRPPILPPLDVYAEAWPQLNKLAFWMATGSGKTLPIHAHATRWEKRPLPAILPEGNKLVLVDEGHRGANG